MEDPKKLSFFILIKQGGEILILDGLKWSGCQDQI